MMHRLDEQTQRDLDLAEVDRRFNLSHTTFGQTVFQRRLGEQPSTDTSRFRIGEIQRLQADPVFSARLDKGLRRLGKQRRGDVFADLAEGLPYRPARLPLVVWWFWLGPLVAAVAAWGMGPLGLLPVLGLLVANLGLYLVTNPKISSWSGSLNYFSAGVVLLGKLDRLEQPALLRLARYNVAFQDGLSSSLTQDFTSMVLDYVRVFLGAELFAYAQVSKLLEAQRDEVPRVLETLGHLDATLVCVRWLASEPSLTHPEFHDEATIQFDGLLHPLVDEGVAQTGELRGHAVVTGMNMAGKSTFLKSLALNQVLACSFGVVFARRFATTNLAVITSLNLADDVVAGKSRYFVEAERLLHIQQTLRQQPLLCLIDEILSGTNTDDRVTASLGLLREFGRHSGSLVLAATHDLIIAETLEGLYTPLCFDGEWEDGRLVFDYQPRPGVASRRNALKLLEMLGLQLQGVKS